MVGMLRLREVQSLAGAHLVLSGLCDLGKLHKPQLQQSKGNNLSMTLLTKAKHLPVLEKLNPSPCLSKGSAFSLSRWPWFQSCPFSYNLWLIPLTRTNGFTFSFIESVQWHSITRVAPQPGDPVWSSSRFHSAPAGIRWYPSHKWYAGSPLPTTCTSFLWFSSSFSRIPCSLPAFFPSFFISTLFYFLTPGLLGV